MLKNLILLSVFALLSTSCVSSKLYKELEGKYSNLKSDYDELSSSNNQEILQKKELEQQLSMLQASFEDVQSERDQLLQELAALQKKYDNLDAAYTALEQNSSKSIEENAQKNRELLAQLEAKEQALAAENERLMRLEADMQERAQRIAELEALISAKDQAMTALKNAISNALTAFEGKGLTIEQRDGKVYVSMENKLLFKSGSWAVGTEGKKAIQQLGKVLGENPDIAVLIEGHTDNVPYSSGGQVANNWDLSTKRATSIIAILSQNENIKLENLTAAGRSEFAPIATNETKEGKSKNRRIEVVLTPKLDEISKLLNTN